jgi:anti-sigma factor RsiW
MSACDDYRSMIPLFLDDELRGNELQDFQEHIMGCAACKEAMMHEQGLSELLHRTRPLYQAPEAFRTRVSGILSSETHAGFPAPEPLHRRILRMMSVPFRDADPPAFPWKTMVAVGLVIVLALLFVPQIVERVRADAFVKTAATTHRSYLDGHLPMEIHTSSPTAVTAWFAGKVPFHFQLPDSQQSPTSEPVYWLAGSRLVNFKGTHAALTTYQMQGEKISLLVVSGQSAHAEGGEAIQSGKLTFHYHNTEGLTVITWTNHGLTYALVSSLPGSARQSCLVCHENMADHLRFSHRQ